MSVAYALLGVVGALSFAFLRSAFAGAFSWPLPLTFGYSEAGSAGTVWAWQHSASLGEHVCRSSVAGAAVPRQTVTPLGPIGWKEGPAPRWAIASEQQTPPAAWPAGNLVLDYAFGWPIPCAGYRELQVVRRATPGEIASLGLAPGDTIVDQTLLRGTHRFGGVFGDGVWPTRILWRGLVVDALVFGLIFALPHVCAACFRTSRAAARRRIVRCPWCGYDRRGHDERAPCPECGGVEPVRPG